MQTQALRARRAGETEKLSTLTAPLGCFLLLLPPRLSCSELGGGPGRGDSGRSLLTGGWVEGPPLSGAALTLGSAGSWASEPTHPCLLGAAGPGEG